MKNRIWGWLVTNIDPIFATAIVIGCFALRRAINNRSADIDKTTMFIEIPSELQILVMGIVVSKIKTSHLSTVNDTLMWAFFLFLETMFACVIFYFEQGIKRNVITLESLKWPDRIILLFLYITSIISYIISIIVF